MKKRFRFAHEQRLERWLGPCFDMIREATRDFYHPIPITHVPGRVTAYRGEIFGEIRGGGFASLSDLISEATAGKRQDLFWVKAGTAGIVGRSNSLWNVGSVPPAGGVGGTTGTGAVKTRTSTGALTQANAAGGDTLHIVTIPAAQASIGPNLLLLYDRLWDMTHTMTVDPRSVDGVNPPNRYNTAGTTPGNFISGEVTTVLPAATPTLTCDYMDQDNAASTSPSLSTIASAAAVNTVPFTAPNWFVPLAAADTGVRRMGDATTGANAFNLSAAMASGVVTWFIGHPLIWIPQPIANSAVIIDGINSAFNLARVYDDACLALMEIAKGATTATNYWGCVCLVSG